MNTSAIKTGDVVRADVGGRRFFAEVRGRENGELSIFPISHNISYRSIKAIEVISHYRKSKQSRV